MECITRGAIHYLVYSLTDKIKNELLKLGLKLCAVLQKSIQIYKSVVLEVIKPYNTVIIVNKYLMKQNVPQILAPCI